MKKIALVLAILLVGTLFGCAAKEDSNTLYGLIIYCNTLEIINMKRSIRL